MAADEHWSPSPGAVRGPDPASAGEAGAPVSLVACASYDLTEVRAALARLLEPLGGMGAFVRPGERIGLKPNLLLSAAPERAITTHPTLVEAVALEIQAVGATPVVIESPGAGIPYSEPILRRIYRKTGMEGVAERTGMELNVDTSSRAVFHPDAMLTKHLDLLTPALEVDGLLSLAKIKTHNFMTLTCAVKNLFGLVPGYAKPGYHAKLADRDRFADMLLDIATCMRPRLTLVDGVVALEGDGPGTAGRPRRLGVLLAGADPVLVDAACCSLVGVDPMTVPVLPRAAARGLWGGPGCSTEWVGDPPEGHRIDDFLLPTLARDAAGYGMPGGVERLARTTMRELFTARPRPQPDRCTGCGTCARACPSEAITIRGRLAAVDDDRCIRCYCCHELCPEAAIELVVGRAGRAVRRLGVR